MEGNISFFGQFILLIKGIIGPKYLNRASVMPKAKVIGFSILMSIITTALFWGLIFVSADTPEGLLYKLNGTLDMFPEFTYSGDLIHFAEKKNDVISPSGIVVVFDSEKASFDDEYWFYCRRDISYIEGTKVLIFNSKSFTYVNEDGKAKQVNYIDVRKTLGFPAVFQSKDAKNILSSTFYKALGIIALITIPLFIGLAFLTALWYMLFGFAFNAIAHGSYSRGELYRIALLITSGTTLICRLFVAMPLEFNVLTIYIVIILITLLYMVLAMIGSREDAGDAKVVKLDGKDKKSSGSLSLDNGIYGGGAASTTGSAFAPRKPASPGTPSYGIGKKDVVKDERIVAEVKPAPVGRPGRQTAEPKEPVKPVVKAPEVKPVEIVKPEPKASKPEIPAFEIKKPEIEFSKPGSSLISEERMNEIDLKIAEEKKSAIDLKVAEEKKSAIDLKIAEEKKSAIDLKVAEEKKSAIDLKIPKEKKSSIDLNISGEKKKKSANLKTEEEKKPSTVANVDLFRRKNASKEKESVLENKSETMETKPASPSIGSSTIGSSTIGSSTIGSSTIGSSTIGSSTIESSTIGSSTIESSTIGSSTIGSATMGSSLMGGGGTFGGALFGSSNTSPLPAKPAKPEEPTVKEEKKETKDKDLKEAVTTAPKDEMDDILTRMSEDELIRLATRMSASRKKEPAPDNGNISIGYGSKKNGSTKTRTPSAVFDLHIRPSIIAAEEEEKRKKEEAERKKLEEKEKRKKELEEIRKQEIKKAKRKAKEMEETVALGYNTSSTAVKNVEVTPELVTEVKSESIPAFGGSLMGAQTVAAVDLGVNLNNNKSATSDKESAPTPKKSSKGGLSYATEDKTPKKKGGLSYATEDKTPKKKGGLSYATEEFAREAVRPEHTSSGAVAAERGSSISTDEPGKIISIGGFRKDLDGVSNIGGYGSMGTTGSKIGNIGGYDPAKQYGLSDGGGYSSGTENRLPPLGTNSFSSSLFSEDGSLNIGETAYGNNIGSFGSDSFFDGFDDYSPRQRVYGETYHAPEPGRFKSNEEAKSQKYGAGGFNSGMFTSRSSAGFGGKSTGFGSDDDFEKWESEFYSDHL